jgi:hypothetical protein
MFVMFEMFVMFVMFVMWNVFLCVFEGGGISVVLWY